MADGPFPALVEAVQQFRGDKYSQAKRWQNGYSDCSSFVGKGMKQLGLNPGGSTTLTYLASSSWTSISVSEAGAGDIAVNSAHMVLVTGNGTAIGQQNPRRNVQEGSIRDLMSGSGPYVFRRYKGGSDIQFAGYSNAQQVGLLSFPAKIIDTFVWLTKTTNWLRIGMVLAGAALVWMTVVGVGRSQIGGLLGETAKKAGKKVMENAKRTTS